MSQDKCPFILLYQDEDIVVVYKKRDVLTIRTEDKKTFNRNLYYYLKQDVIRDGEKLFVLHRLDYETSGILVFPKKKEVFTRLQSFYVNRSVERLYEAVIKENIPLGERFEVHQLLDDAKKVQVSIDGKEAITSFAAVNRIQLGTALDIRINTGRRNQIRIALHDCGYTLLGDRRYSNDFNKRMYLNSYRLVFPIEAKLKKREFSLDPLWIKESIV